MGKRGRKWPPRARSSPFVPFKLGALPRGEVPERSPKDGIASRQSGRLGEEAIDALLAHLPHSKLTEREGVDFEVRPPGKSGGTPVYLEVKTTAKSERAKGSRFVLKASERGGKYRVSNEAAHYFVFVTPSDLHFAPGPAVRTAVAEHLQRQAHASFQRQRRENPEFPAHFLRILPRKTADGRLRVSVSLAFLRKRVPLVTFARTNEKDIKRHLSSLVTPVTIVPLGTEMEKLLRRKTGGSLPRFLRIDHRPPRVPAPNSVFTPPRVQRRLMPPNRPTKR